MSVRAGIVVTGTEVLTGQVSDRNGPWVSQQLLGLGVDVAHIDVVGDRPEDLEAALRFLAGEGLDLIVTSGGLGPTADDLTAAVVAEFQGRAMQLDAKLEARIAAIVGGIGRRAGWDPDALADATRKQAFVPEGASVLEPVGTAPGLVVPVAEGRTGPSILVLPGPPRELQGMWPAAVAAPAFLQAVAGRVELREGMLRLYGTPESEIAATLRAVGDDALRGLEVTTCLRGGELEVATRYEPGAQDAYEGLVAAIRERHGETLFSEDGSTIDDLVVAGLLGRGWTIATAESCTGGLLAGRLTERAGSSAYVMGGVAAYSNGAKTALVGVPAELIERVGAVSVEVAAALARGARERLGADVGVGITGVAGPGGGTPEKPVGHVCFSVAGPDGAMLTRAQQLPGGRADVRARSLVVALHLVRRLLAGESD